MQKVCSLLFTITFYFLLCAVNLEIYAGQQDEYQKNIEEQAQMLSKEWNGESIRRSILLYHESSNYWLKQNEPNKATNQLREIARLNLLLNNPTESIKILETANIIDNQNKYLSGRIDNLSLEAIIQLDLGNLKKSEILITQAQDLLINSNNKNNEISVFFASALFYFRKHENQRSIDFFERAINIASEIEATAKLGELKYELSYVYLAIGDYATARIKANEALQNWQNINDKRGRTLSFLALARVEWLSENKQISLEYLRQAEILFPNDIAFYDKANLFNGFASIFEDYKSLELGLKYRKQALDSFRQAQHIFGQISTLLRLANLSLQLNDNNSTFEYLNEAKSLATRVNDRFFLAVSNVEMANYYLAVNDIKSAKIFYHKALETLDKEIYKHDIALIFLRLGAINLNQHNFAEARKYFNLSLDLNIKTRDQSDISQTQFYLSKLNLLENKSDEAIENIKKSLLISENLYSDVANSNLKRTYFSNIYDRYELYIQLLIQKYNQSSNKDYVIQALQTSEKIRSRSLLETLRLSEANFTKDASPELIKHEKEIRNLLNLKSNKLTALLSKNAEGKEIVKIEDEISSLENELENIKAELKQKSPVYSAIKNPSPFNVTEFQQNVLDEKTLLLEFSLREQESYLWILSKNDISYVVLPARSVIENRIEKIHKTFEARQMLPDEELETYQKRIAELEDIFNQEAKVLSKELLGQITEKITNKRLIVVPDGKLALLPLSALPFPNSDAPLISQNEIVYEPSASLLNLSTKIQNHQNSFSKDILIFADPIFSADDNRLMAKSENQNSPLTFLGLNLRDFRLLDANGKIPRLFASQDEAASIATVIGSSQTEIVSGFSANRERVLNTDISDYRILHFATHGLVDIDRPEISSIVLSQFDENGQPQEGFLRLQDIYALNLASDLVVLSSCQSGVGKEIRGEGLMSINNAFLRAGAKSVLASAWKVDDYATAELMKNFYDGLIDKKLTPPEALRQSQLKMRESSQFSSPFYWAAFTIQGEFRQPVSLSNDNKFYYMKFVILAILLAGTLAGLRFLRRYRTVKL